MTADERDLPGAAADAAFLDVPPAALPLSDELASYTETAKEYGRNALADNTRTAYGFDCKDFDAFCERHGLCAFPATSQTIAVYVTAIATVVKPSTIYRRIAAIRRKHNDARLPDPTNDDAIKSIMRGIARKHGTPPVSKKPITDEHLYAVLLALEQRPKETGDQERDREAWRRAQLRTLRDRALVLLGFAGAFRRSELVALDVADLQWHPSGFRVLVRKSKTDQEQRGRFKPIPRAPVKALDPVQAIEDYRRAWNIVDGALFRSMDIDGNVTDRRLGAGEVARIVKRAAKRAGLDPDAFAGHSLRSGFVTAAATKGASIPDIAQVSHQSKATVLRYWKEAKEFVNPPLLRILGVEAPTLESKPTEQAKDE